MSELYEDLLWFRQMDNDMDKFLVSLSDREGQAGGVPYEASASANSCGDVEGHVNSRLGDWPHRTRTVLSLPLGNSKAVKPISEYQASPAGLRITEAPEPQ
jgi:hypothetical protein